jgi:2',3'-cyclic-nucleotide 2'-phosphodiesterase (5'-nucleotidase family)
MKKPLLAIIIITLMTVSCATHYRVTDISMSRILIDSTFDTNPDPQAAAFMVPYKKTVDSLMSPVVGHVARYMWADRPESNLSNLLADILIWAGKAYNEQPAFSLYNMGGIRASLSKGEVTYGNVLEVAPFENKICFFDLSGTSVMKLFKQIAANGGEGISHGVELVITKQGELLSAKVDGNDVDPNATYRVASIDYLAQGNDGLIALKEKTNVNSPQDKKNNLRFIIMDYFKEKASKGEVVDCKIEGRIILK